MEMCKAPVNNTMYLKKVNEMNEMKWKYHKAENILNLLSELVNIEIWEE